MAVRIVQHAFDIIHLLTDENPIQVRLLFFFATFTNLISLLPPPSQVLVTAIQQASPREDSTRIGSGGVARRQVNAPSAINHPLNMPPFHYPSLLHRAPSSSLSLTGC
jgi:hypothetical protein